MIWYECGPEMGHQCRLETNSIWTDSWVELPNSTGHWRCGSQSLAVAIAPLVKQLLNRLLNRLLNTLRADLQLTAIAPGNSNLWLAYNPRSVCSCNDPISVLPPTSGPFFPTFKATHQRMVPAKGENCQRAEGLVSPVTLAVGVQSNHVSHLPPPF